MKKHKKNHNEKYYYKIRKQFKNDNDIEIAARFIYLNKTCYNGLYRVNKKREFNVPAGTYKAPVVILDEVNIMTCHRVLQNVEVKYQSYDDITPKKEDFVYIDPPYYSINDNSFTKYTKLDFTEESQIKLFDFCKKLASQNICFMLSNSNSQFIKNLYKDFNIEIVSAPRNINCKPNGRQMAKEVIIRNYATWGKN